LGKLSNRPFGAAISYQLSAISYQLSAISYQLSAISYQLSAISYQLSAISFKKVDLTLWDVKESPRDFKFLLCDVLTADC
jgi:hypothetical protein